MIICSTCVLILLELRRYVLPLHAESPRVEKTQAQLVLISDIPAEWRTDSKLQHLYGRLPGLQTIWVHRDLQTLRELISRRNHIIEISDKAETKLNTKMDTSDGQRSSD